MQRFWLLISLLIYFVIIILPNTAAAQSERDTVQYTLADTIVANQLLEEMKQLIAEQKWVEAEAKGEQARAIYEQLLGKECKQMGDVWHQMGRMYGSKRDNDKAIFFYEKGLIIRLKTLEEEHPDVANSYYGAGVSYYRNKENNKAIEYLLKALEIRQNAFGEENLETADAYNVIGIIYLDKSAFEQSIEYLRKALMVRIKLLGNNNVNVASSYRNLSIVYSASGKYKEALAALQESLDIRIKVGNKQEQEIAITFNDIGIIYEELGNYDLGLEYKQKALHSLTSLLGDEHPDVAVIYLNLGTSMVRQGKYSAAIHYLEKALTIHLKTLGDEHLTVADSYFNLGVVYDELGNFKNGLNYREKALALYKKILGDDHPRVLIAYGGLGNTYARLQQYDDAVENYNKALILQQKISGYTHPEVARSYFNLGVVHKLMGQYNEGIQFTYKALEIRLKNYGEIHPEVAECYNNLGIFFELQGDNRKAIESYHKTLKILQKTLTEYHPNVGDAYINLGIAYQKSSNFESAIDYFEKALQISLNTFGEIHESVSRCYSNLGSAYENIGNKDKALEYKRKALQIDLKALGESHMSTATAYNNLGASHFEFTQLDSANIYFKKSLFIRSEKLGNVHPDVASSYLNLGFTNYGMEKYEQALEYLIKSLNACQYEENNLDKVTSFEHLIPTLRIIATIYEKQYRESNDPRLIDKSYQYFQRALAAVEYLINSLDYKDSKILWQNKNFNVYKQIIDISLLKAEVDQDDKLRRNTFTYAEQSKATQLQAQLKAADALAFAGIPDSLTQKEYDLRIDITWREKQRQALLDQGKSETDTTVLRISSIIFDLRQEYDSLKQRLEVDYPDYYRAKYDLSTVSVYYVQDSLLQTGQSLVEYFVGDSSLFIFLVQPNHYEVQEVKMDTSFQQWIRDMTQEGLYGHYSLPESMRSRPNLANSKRRYAAAAAKLYQALIAPIQDKLTTEVIIVPDGALGYVPFEALLKSEPSDPSDFSTYEYLLQDHQISYSYSATLLKEMRNKQHRQQPSGKLLAFAPFFLGDADTLVVHVDTSDITYDLVLKDKLEALDESGLEIKTITKRLKGDPYYGANASIQRFQDLASQYRILHLSTHAKADDRVGDYAYLAFGFPDAKGEFAKLYARDLYNISLNADMVVLSACETGIGKLQRGEGIVSLARAFAYAGAKSIVTTLWKVEENATKDLVISFYKYLKKGKTKDEALRLAKLEYIKDNAKDNEKLHPFFWASMIGIGDMSAIR